MKKKIWILVIILVIIFSIYVSFQFLNRCDGFKNNSEMPIELVVARYNENLDWLNTEPYNKYPVFIYNKGINENYSVNSKNIRIKRLNNVGKCDHTYLYHIIHNYDNLANVTVFLPGSANMENKIEKTNRIMSELKKNKTSIFIGQFMQNVQNQLYNFTISTYKTANDNNFDINSSTYVEQATIRPFGKWYEKVFGDIQITHVSYCGIMAISKKHILQHPKKYYERLIEQLNKSSSPEEGHYFERAWEAVFYPMNDAVFINSLSKTKHILN